MSKFLSIQEAAKHLGVSKQTLRRWEKEEKIEPPQRTRGGQRRYDITKLCPTTLRNLNNRKLPTIAYARVSSHDQKEDLQRQVNMLELYCSSQGWSYEVISDLARISHSLSDNLDNLLHHLCPQ